ncbi:MAG: SpoIIE family protein phosphatase [Chitinophagaceae bacterium]|nr:SpoIIE family protein phosphatase [Oligoflexus sp.]
MTRSSPEQVSSATTIATHEVISDLIRAKSAMETLVHEMHDLTCLVTCAGRILWGNRSAAVWLGVDHDLLHESSLAPLFSETDWAAFLERLQSLTAQSAFVEFHSRFTSEGKSRDVLWNVRPFKAVSDRRGLLLHVVGRDITDVLRERTEKTKLESELETAQFMQFAFFPPTHIVSETVEICSYYRAADQCSGDWWGYFDLGNRRELVCIADVTGHGAASALVTAMTQASCLAFVRQHGKAAVVSPALLIHEINDVVYKTFKGDIYMTFFALVFDHGAKTCVFSNAAHNFPLSLRIGRDKGKHAEALFIQGNPVGHSSESIYMETQRAIHKGDRFILYTDGITECRNPEKKMYGMGNFRRSILKHAEKMPLTCFRDALIDDAQAFFQGQPLADDLTLATLDIL